MFDVDVLSDMSVLNHTIRRWPGLFGRPRRNRDWAGGGLLLIKVSLSSYVCQPAICGVHGTAVSLVPLGPR